MPPLPYLILIRWNGPPYSEVTWVNLPSSLMIVHSNAFVFSTCLLVVVFRYGILSLFRRSKLIFQNTCQFSTLPLKRTNVIFFILSFFVVFTAHQYEFVLWLYKCVLEYDLNKVPLGILIVQSVITSKLRGRYFN